MGDHINPATGQFQSDKHPELPPDKIIVSFRDPLARSALRALASSYATKGGHEAELASDILARLRSLEVEEAEARRRELEANAPPVDRSQTQLAGGGAVTSDHRDINPETGQQKGYVVLSPEERAKGFVRPVRRSYTHETCKAVTTMSVDLAETYARDPKFYSGTFCISCRDHFPLSEFKWEGTDETLGS